MMHLKKSKPSTEELAQQNLVQKVDAMMSVEAVAAAKPVPAKLSTKAAKTPAVESVSTPVSEAQATAPQLPSQLLKTIGKKPPKSTLKIIKDEPAAEPAPEPEPEATPDIEPIEDPAPADKTALDDDPLKDSDTDKAVDSIMAEEADMQLAVVDAVNRQKNADQDNGPGLLHRFFTSPWTWLFIVGIAGVTYAWYH